MTEQKTVTIFGSSIPKPGSLEYETAETLGKILAQNGITVCSGGYQGIMDAVSKGAVENGGKAIGVTVNLFGSTPSKYLTEEIVCRSLFERIETLIKKGDAYVILQGGTGTLVELSIVWELINKKLINKKPVASHSTMWKEIVYVMEEQIEKENRETGLIKCFDEITDLADYIIEKLSY